MKIKRFISIILCIAVMLSFCACSGYRTYDSNVTIREHDQISFTADGEITEAGGKLLLQNNSNDILYHWGSLKYTLQIFKEDTWYTVGKKSKNRVDFGTELASDNGPFDLASRLKPGESTAVIADWYESIGNLRRGKYRIVKEVSIDKGEPFYIDCEFVIE